MVSQGPWWGPGEMFLRDHRVRARSHAGTRQGTGLARQSFLELRTGNGVGTGTEPGIRFVYPVALPPVRVLGKIAIKRRGCFSAVHVPCSVVDVRVVLLLFQPGGEERKRELDRRHMISIKHKYWIVYSCGCMKMDFMQSARHTLGP